MTLNLLLKLGLFWSNSPVTFGEAINHINPFKYDIYARKCTRRNQIEIGI